MTAANRYKVELHLRADSLEDAKRIIDLKVKHGAQRADDPAHAVEWVSVELLHGEEGA